MAVLIRAKGLKTFYNELGLDEGALLTADNIVIDRNDVINPRRGLKSYGTAAPAAGDYCQIIAYKDRILPHDGTKLYFDCCCTEGSFSAFAGCYLPLEAGLRIKSVESNSNLYFTTTEGIQKISGTLSACPCCACIDVTNFSTAPCFITNAGGPKALDVSGTLSFSCGAFLCPLSKTAYRVVWGTRDNNKNLILGSPSSRFIIANSDCAQSANVCLTFSVPSDVNTTCFFYQVYRTGIVTTCCVACVPCLEPGDEMNLIIENALTPCDLCTGTISVQDATADCFRSSGVLLYTNPTSGDGILQANEKPPVAKDIEIFRETIFYANTQTIQRKQFNLLSVSCFTSGCSKLVIGNCTNTREYTFVGAKETSTITVPAPGNCSDSLNGSYFLLNSASNATNYFFWFESIACTVEPSACDTTGRIPIKVSITSCATQCSVACVLNTQIATQTDFTSSVCANVVTAITVKNGNAVDIADGTTATCFTLAVTSQGDGEAPNACNPCGGDVLLSSLISPSQSIDETARSIVNIVNRDTCGIANAFYLSGEDDLPGVILLEGRNLSDSEFFVGVCDSCISNKFSPVLPPARGVTGTAGACCCTKTVITTCGNHGYSNNDDVYVYNTACCTSLLGKYTVTNKTCTTFTVAQAFCCSTTGDVFKATEASDNEVKPNRIYFSKKGIPEAVPLVNFLDVGRQDSAIQRILALRDNLFIMKDDGVYILTGDDGNFTVRLLDNSTNIIAPDSAAILNNQIFMLSTQGVTSVTDTGIGIISRPIEDKILDVASAPCFCTKTAAFGMGYESDRSYLLWVPEESSDTVATQVYRYNTFNRSWVRWTIAAKAGLVNPVDDKMYISSGDSSFIRRERKLGDRTDFADEEACLCVIENSIVDCVDQITLSSTTCVENGDVLVQTQFLTVSKMNRFLRKLDFDPGCLTCCYVSTYELNASECVAQRLRDVAAQICCELTITPLAVPCSSICTTCNTFTNCCSNTVESGLRAVITSPCCSPVTSPAGLLDGCDVVYFTCVSCTTFKVSATRGGTAINVTCAGSGIHTFTPVFATPAAAPSTICIIRTDYNELTDNLNVHPDADVNDYTQIAACDCTEHETIITGVNKIKNTVCVGFSVPLLSGSVVHYKGIQAVAEYAPQHFGDPSILKQVSEGTIVFDGNNFFKANISYSTDLSKDFTCYQFDGRGPGFWSGFDWTCTAWGGEGTDVPYRTLIPRAKQRCRYISAKFAHIVAREDFSILGISFKVRPLSERGYRAT